MQVNFLSLFMYLLGAPLLGGVISGLDRIITARLQGRRGPSLWQSFYDVGKLLEKEKIVVRRTQNVYIFFYLLFSVFTGALFFAGEDLLLTIFSLTIAGIFLVLAGYKGGSPFSFIGAEREMLQIMAYEPMILLSAVGFYLSTHSFYVSDIWAYGHILIKLLPGVFLGLIYVLTIKLRKSPFDLSTSHHAHQELVKGVTTEYSGQALAWIEIAHWYETVFILGFIYLFFAAQPLLGLFACAVVYFLEILIDNISARVKWPVMIFSCWLVTLVLGFGNIMFLIGR